MSFVVLGIWSGYNGRDKLVHQETIHNDNLKDKYDAIKEIRYTDGTFLSVSTYNILEPPQKLGYKELLDKAIQKGLSGHFSIMDL